MYNLTQLKQAGFKFTPLELSVFNNPSFRYLYGRWPFKFGSLTTGLVAEVGKDYYQNETLSFESTDQSKLTPSGAAGLYDEISGHLRSILILSAKVARDASDNSFDQGLVQDLSLWLDGIKTIYYKPFRWVRFERDHQQQIKKNERAEEVVQLSNGNANVIVLLLNKLDQGVREAVRNAVEADCIERGIFSKEDNDRQSRYFHFPWPQCMLCNGSSGRSGGRHCDNSNSIVLVDCGDVPTIIKSVPSEMRRIVKSVRFTVPRSTFSDQFESFVGNGFFPQFAIFLLNLLSKEEQQKFKSELNKCLEAKQNQGFHKNSLIVAPEGRQRVNALLLAGSVSWNSWNYILKDSELWYELKNRVSVDLVE